MNGSAKRILKELAKNGELSVDAAVKLAKPIRKDHIDQYPLALLIEAGYVGLTITYSPPSDAEEMREFALAKTLHMFGLPKDEHGEIRYLDIVTTGSLDPRKECIFLKAAGALYLESELQRQRERVYSFLVGFSAGFLSLLLSSWLLSLDL